MKKYILLFATIFLVACGSGHAIEIHENIDEDMAKDTINLVDSLGEVIESTITFTEEDDYLYENYLREGLTEHSEEEVALLVKVIEIINKHHDQEYTMLDNGLDEFHDDVEEYLNILKTGER